MPAYVSRLAACSVALVSALTLGCGTTEKPMGNPPEQHHDKDGHDHSAEEHSHTGPHGGHLVELGANEEYHAEMLHDDDTGLVTIYILDGAAKKNVPLKESDILINMMRGDSFQQYKLTANPHTNEPRDSSSCFQVQNAELCKALDAEDCKGRLAINISGKQFVGEIEHHSHADTREHHGGQEPK